LVTLDLTWGNLARDFSNQLALGQQSSRDDIEMRRGAEEMHFGVWDVASKGAPFRIV
jgi:hypothetical protein